MERSRGVPDSELFLSKPAPEDCDSPTVEPLRIFKPQSPEPYSRVSSTSSNRPTFPLPPGASSSAAPLPFPDDDDIHKPIVPKPTAPKPYGSAYNDPSYNDTSPRLDTNVGAEKKPGLAERRGAAPKPIHSPSSPDTDYGLFAKPLQDKPAASTTNYPTYQKTYYPPPGAASSGPSGSASAQPQQYQQPQHYQQPQPHAPQQPPKVPQADHLAAADSGVNRFASTASNSTTRASRGSPPPPETPIVGPGSVPGGGIEARYAASGISGTATLTSLQTAQVQSAAAAQRLAHYNNQQPQPQRPWTPTESPDQAPSGPPTVYQGMNPVSSPQPQHPVSSPPPQQHPAQNQGNAPPQVSVLEQDFQRMSTSSPPPAYSSVNPSGRSSYPNEKQRPQQANQTPGPSAIPAGVPFQASASASAPPVKDTVVAAATAAATAAAAAGLSSAAPHNQGHPAFANDPRPEPVIQHTQVISVPPNLAAAGPASPPPLPEGWIAHLDQNSGQYYYIHLATQATQWEFPKGPNPIQHEQAPLSPTASTYGNPLASPMFGKTPMASPMFPPHTPGYAESIMSV
ncbi:hypothetical protein BBK36DRAFT_105489, partial [Trichoderma citrinoviride]